MDIEALVRLKLALEFGVEPMGDRLPPATSNREGQPRVIVSRHAGGYTRFFRHDVPETTRTRLLALDPARAVADQAAVRAILETDAPVRDIWRVRWYVAEQSPQPDEYPDAVARDGRWVIEVDGRVVAWARTDAESEAAMEVGVETLPEFRSRGYARQVVAAWIADALRQGKVAYYSHVWDNLGSAGVARSLGLRHLCDEVEFQ